MLIIIEKFIQSFHSHRWNVGRASREGAAGVDAQGQAVQDLGGSKGIQRVSEQSGPAGQKDRARGRSGWGCSPLLLVVWLFQEVTGSRVTNPMEVLGINWVPDLSLKRQLTRGSRS